MSSLYEPPLIPGLGSQVGPIAGGGNYAPTRNPFFSVGNQFLPRNLYDVIRWVRFITVNSPVSTEVIRKLSTYPITQFIHSNKNSATKARYNEIIKSFNLKSTLHNIGFQYYTVGNVFLSIYFPIHRTHTCKNCGTQYTTKNASFLKFENFEFTGTCPSCNFKGKFSRNDTKSVNVSDMNLILWDPLNIVVNHNPITGKSRYYYRIPNDIKKRIRQGDSLILESLPWEFIEAVKDNKDFEFEEGHIFHLKNIDMGFSINGIAVPPLVSHFALTFYQATLRRANESISTDYMAPMRVVFPQPQTGNSDPVVSLSMRNFTSRMEEAIVKHKIDNNHVLIAPVPIGYQAISGEGKTLLVSQEIAQAEESLLLSFGVSRELLSGTTNWTSSTVGLRMLKNTLDNYVGQVEGLLDWIFSTVASYLSLEANTITLTPFQLTDDENLKAILMGLSQSGQVSMTTIYESIGRDYSEELEKMLQEAKEKARHDVRLQFEVEQAQYLEGLEISKENNKDSSYQDALKQAQGLVQELMSVPPETSKKVLDELRVTDYAKYLMVSKLLEEARTSQTMTMNQQLNDQAMQNSVENGPPQDQGQASIPTQPQASGGAPAGSATPGSQGE